MHPLHETNGEDAEETTEERRSLRTQATRAPIGGGYDRDQLPFTFVLPLGGGGIAPALSFPVGGANSPFAVALPLASTTASQTPTVGLPAVAVPVVSPGPPVAPDAPVVVADPTAIPLTDADELIAGASEKSATDFIDVDESDEWSHDEAAAPSDESDEGFGERLVGVAEALAGDPRAIRFTSGELLQAILDSIGLGRLLSPLLGRSGHAPSATELYNAFVHDQLGLRSRPHRDHYSRLFAPVALPGSPLRGIDLLPGDIMTRVARGEGWGQFSIIASPRLLSQLELPGARPGDFPPGGYVPVIECMRVPRLRTHNFVRRLTNEAGQTLADTLILRIRRSTPVAGEMESETEKRTDLGSQGQPSVLARGASGAAVRGIQAKLNRFSLDEVAAGRAALDACPLVEDGKFGPLTERAVRDFQMRQFSDDPLQWDGIIGPATRQRLDAVMADALTSPSPAPRAESAQDVAALRRGAEQLLNLYVPGDTGDTRFDEILQDYTGTGSSSGYLCHWLLWRLGCTDRNIVNRSAPNGYAYHAGQNVKRIWNGGHFPFEQVLGTDRIAAGDRPARGDIVYMATPGRTGNDHLFVFLEEHTRDGRTFWRGADAGQRNAAGQPCARFVERELIVDGQNALLRRGSGSTRTVYGWLPLDNLPFGSPPVSLAHVPPAAEAEGSPGEYRYTADLSDGFFTSLRAVAGALQTQPEYMLAVMNSESSLRASAHNPNGHASGLIQFMPATLANLGWTQGHEAFRRLTAEEQLPFVQRYYQPYVRQGLNSTARLYQTTFLPATLSRGSEPDTVLVDVNNDDNAFAYAPNRGLDRRGDGRILVGDLTAFVDRAKRSARWREAFDRLQSSAASTSTSEALPADVSLLLAESSPPHPEVRVGSIGDPVREAQTKLNIVHGRNIASSLPGLQGAPLAIDGIFGPLTRNATVSFQQQAFPADPREWDGVIGSKTWAKLDAAAAGPGPAPTPIVTVFDIAEYVPLEYVLESLLATKPSVFRRLSPFRDLVTLRTRIGASLVALLLGGGGPISTDPGDPAKFRTRVRAQLAFPALSSNPSTPSGNERLPLAVLVHGNHRAYFTAGGVLSERPSYRGYRYLQEELARQGIASISVDTNMANQTGSFIELRADLVLEAMKLVRRQASIPGGGLFNRIDFGKVALMGHSRGGDAVVRVVKKNQAAAGGQRFGIRTVCSLSPTDVTGGQIPVDRTSVFATELAFYSVLYGGLDGDVSGLGGSDDAFGTGFRHYDRANCPKALVFAERFCHNSFNSIWQSDGLDGDLDPADIASGRLIDEATHQALAKEFIGGQFAWHLKGVVARSGLFNGTIASATGQAPVLLWKFGSPLQPVDDFESGAATLGTRRLNGGTRIEDFGSIRVAGSPLNDHVLEQTRVVNADTTAATGSPFGVEVALPPGRRDLTPFTTLALDIGAFVDTTSPATISAATPPTFSVGLRDAAGSVVVVDATRFSPAMSKPSFHHLASGDNVTALHLQTLKVPLSQFSGIDLRNIALIQVEVLPPAGDLFIDDIKLAAF